MDKTEDEERGSESVVRDAGVLFWYEPLNHSTEQDFIPHAWPWP